MNIENANMSYDGDVIGSVVMYSCLPGHQLIGAATRICGNYTWSGKSPVCKGKREITDICGILHVHTNWHPVILKIIYFRAT